MVFCIRFSVIGNNSTLSKIGAKKTPVKNDRGIKKPSGGRWLISKDGDGYKMSYQANDPKTMYKTTSVDQKGLFKKLNKQVAEQYTMDGATHLGYAGAVGKTAAQAGLNVECIKAEGGGQSTGRVVGASIGAAAAPAFTGIPFIGPGLGGLVALGGADQGGKIGGQIATEFNEACDDPDTKSTD